MVRIVGEVSAVASQLLWYYDSSDEAAGFFVARGMCKMNVPASARRARPYRQSQFVAAPLCQK
jgi:hypothetical protein